MGPSGKGCEQVRDGHVTERTHNPLIQRVQGEVLVLEQDGGCSRYSLLTTPHLLVTSTARLAEPVIEA